MRCEKFGVKNLCALCALYASALKIKSSELYRCGWSYGHANAFAAGLPTVNGSEFLDLALLHEDAQPFLREAVHQCVRR